MKAGEPKYMKALAFSSDVGDTPAEVGPFGDAASFQRVEVLAEDQGRVVADCSRPPRGAFSGWL